VSTLANEVDNPVRTFPRALGLAMVFVAAMYLLVLGVAIGNVPDDIGWETSELADAGSYIAGDWLRIWIVLSVAGSSAGLFLADLSTNTFMLDGMAEIGMLPKVSCYPKVPLLTASLIYLHNFIVSESPLVCCFFLSSSRVDSAKMQFSLQHTFIPCLLQTRFAFLLAFSCFVDILTFIIPFFALLRPHTVPLFVPRSPHSSCSLWLKKSNSFVTSIIVSAFDLSSHYC
jgi:amino acid transporter